MTRPGGFTDELRVQAGGSGRVEISGKQSDMFSLPLTGCQCGHPRPSALRQSHTSRHGEPLSMAICTEVAVWHLWVATCWDQGHQLCGQGLNLGTEACSGAG